MSDPVQVQKKAWYVVVWEWVTTAWGKIEAFFQFLDGPGGKFSSKRLMALAAFVIAIRQLIIGDKWGAAGAAIFALVLAVVAAITKT